MTEQIMTEQEKDAIRLEVKTKQFNKLNQELQQYEQNEGPIKNSKTAKAASEVRDELAQEIKELKEKLK